MDNLLITRREASCILWTLDHFYKLGVQDAQEERDEMFCLEFIEKTLVPGSFGRVKENTLLSGSEWILFILYELRSTNVITAMRKFMNKITRNNFYWCVLPIIQDFYNKGIKDFYKYPRYNGIEVFMSNPFVKWKNGKPIRRDELIEDMQFSCYSRTKSDQENFNKSSKSANRYNIFQKSIFLACKGNKKWVENL